jgi:hypothetical protein
MSMKRVWTALLLAAASALCVACESNAKSCNEFFDVAAPIMSSVAVPTSAPSGSAAIAWARGAAKQYARLAQETEKISERTLDKRVQSALWEEKGAAAAVAKELDELAEAATAVDPPRVARAKSALSNAARAERDAASVIEQQCAK